MGNTSHRAAPQNRSRKQEGFSCCFYARTVLSRRALTLHEKSSKTPRGDSSPKQIDMQEVARLLAVNEDEETTEPIVILSDEEVKRILNEQEVGLYGSFSTLEGNTMATPN